MNITKITPNYVNKINKTNLKDENTNKNIEEQNNSTDLVFNNNYVLPFLGRVDKSLGRFYAINKDVMPTTVAQYVRTLEDINSETPLEAQYNAFINLEDVESVEEIKQAYPNEELFKDLKPSNETKATRGLLDVIRTYKDIMELYGQTALDTNEDLTVYLVKKVFLEAKTINEINEDLELDLTDEVKKIFAQKHDTKQYVTSSTLDALGIKMPKTSYLTSLRYTRDGYSDKIGIEISKALNKFWASLTPEQRTAKAKKSVVNFEKWWFNLSMNEKLDMIASLEPTDLMLKEFKRVQRAKRKVLKEENPEEYDAQTKENRTKVASKLSQDDLFKMWATHNLKAYEDSLSQADKDTLHLKRVRNLFVRWANMSNEERVEYISKMKAGSEPIRFAMIEAWNKSKNIIIELSDFLEKNQVYKPMDLLFTKKEFSEFQSKVMKEFWDLHPEFAQQLGEEIKKAMLKVEDAIANGKFEALKSAIGRDKKYRQQEIERLKFKNTMQVETPAVVEERKDAPLDYKARFRLAHTNSLAKIKNIPVNYAKDFQDYVVEDLPQNILEFWTAHLNGEQLMLDEQLALKDGLEYETSEVARIQRAFEFSLADALYYKTKSPEVFELSSSDLKVLMHAIERHQSPVKFESQKNNKIYTFELVDDRPVDRKRLNRVYEESKKDLDIKYYYKIVTNYFDISSTNDIEVAGNLIAYLETYGNVLMNIYSEKSAYPMEIKMALSNKLNRFLPNKTVIKPKLTDENSFIKERKLQNLHYSLAKKFYFLPSDILKIYSDIVEAHLRHIDVNEEQIYRLGKPRKSITDHSLVAYIDEESYSKDDALKMLAIRQALADVLYLATDNKDVYRMNFDSLIDKIEVLYLAKNFPTAPAKVPNMPDVEIIAKRKLNLNGIKLAYKEYLKEAEEWSKENKESSNPDYEDLMFRLNPKEDEPLIDQGTMESIMKYKLQ